MRFLLKKTSNCIVAIRREFYKSESTLKGEMFEEYVRTFLFPKDRYELLYKTPSFDSSDIIKSLTFPDFHFLCKETNKKLCVEAKFRSTYNPNYDVEICKDSQLKRYKDFGSFQSCNVYIILGLGGTCHNPDNLYLVPISKRNTVRIPKDEISMYRVNKKHVINLSYIKSLELGYSNKELNEN